RGNHEAPSGPVGVCLDGRSRHPVDRPGPNDGPARYRGTPPTPAETSAPSSSARSMWICTSPTSTTAPTRAVTSRNPRAGPNGDVPEAGGRAAMTGPVARIVLVGLAWILLVPTQAGAYPTPQVAVQWTQNHFDAAHDGYNPYETILS